MWPKLQQQQGLLQLNSLSISKKVCLKESQCREETSCFWHTQYNLCTFNFGKFKFNEIWLQWTLWLLRYKAPNSISSQKKDNIPGSWICIARTEQASNFSAGQRGVRCCEPASAKLAHVKSTSLLYQTEFQLLAPRRWNLVFLQQHETGNINNFASFHGAGLM